MGVTSEQVREQLGDVWLGVFEHQLEAEREGGPGGHASEGATVSGEMIEIMESQQSETVKRVRRE